MLVLAPAWVAWCLGRSPVFLRPLTDVAFLKTAGRGVAEHLDEAEAQCFATGRPAWDRYTRLHRIHFCLWGVHRVILGFLPENADRLNHCILAIR